MRQQGPAPALLPVQVLRVGHTGGCTSSGFTHWVCRCIPCPWWGDKSRGRVTHLHREKLCGAPPPLTSPLFTGPPPATSSSSFSLSPPTTTTTTILQLLSQFGQIKADPPCQNFPSFR